MNKQEAIEKIKNLEGLTILDNTINFDSEMIPKKEVLNIVKQLDEPDKPVVPQFVADWYEENKDDFEDKVYDLFVKFYEDKRELDTEIYWWFKLDVNKPIETLVKMKLFGYEVEKEKLYTVELPIHNGPLGFHYVLRKNKEGEIVMGSFYNKHWRNYDYCQLTEAEIKKDHEWAWKYAEEV